MGIDGAEIKRTKEDHQSPSDQADQLPQPKPPSKLTLFVIIIFSICTGYFGREYIPDLKKHFRANEETSLSADVGQEPQRADNSQNFVYDSIYSGKTRGEIESACRQHWSGADVVKCVNDNVEMRRTELNNRVAETEREIKRRKSELKDQLTEIIEEYERACRKEHPPKSQKYYKCMEWADKQRADISSWQ